MKLIFDTSVWVAHLRSGALDAVVPTLRGRFWLWFDSVSVAELLAGARSKGERNLVTKLIRPFEKAGRIAHPEPAISVAWVWPSGACARGGEPSRIPGPRFSTG